MKLSNNHTSLDFEREPERVRVTLLSTQFKKGALTELPEDVTVEEGEESWTLSYPLPESAQSLSETISKTSSRLERLLLAQKLLSLSASDDELKNPFLHPENLFLESERIFVVHFGLTGLVAPMTQTEEELLNSYKALVLNILTPKSSFEEILSGTAGDKVSQVLGQCETLEEIQDLITEEVQKETAKVNQKVASVSKSHYRFFKYGGMIGLVLTIVFGILTFSYYRNSQKDNAIITAQTDFLTNNYAKTQSDLENYAPTSLPKSARYVLAVSSINLTDLTLAQKQAILNTISTKSDDNTLDYWVYTGRGDFNKALNLAQNLGDDQLTLLAYTNLYETTKLNSTMDGAKKQALLEDYTKKIEELTKSLGK